MPRRPRRELPDGYFHVTSLGVDRCAIVRDDLDRTALREFLLQTEDRFGLVYDAWCLMTTHFHAVLDARQSTLTAAMHWIKSVHAQRFNARYDRCGHLFANRFEARALESEEHWLTACRYVFDNPVKAGLCNQAREWPWAGGRFASMR
jgi:putative transposase